MIAAVSTHLHYWLAGTLMLVGLYGMLTAPNLVRKLMGMNILQTSVIIFFLILGAKTDGMPPLTDPYGRGASADAYVNPLPHALMLTAIVVGISTTGVALALAIGIERRFGTLEEPELLAKLTE